VAGAVNIPLLHIADATDEQEAVAGAVNIPLLHIADATDEQL